ncbi:hypothetical protein DFH09DRAFT_1325118 [Mycena vulgaris]|nr:hypothetical protein DFH09DRAFT_1325118 [Mycena vulgaris]
MAVSTCAAHVLIGAFYASGLATSNYILPGTTPLAHAVTSSDGVFVVACASPAPDSNVSNVLVVAALCATWATFCGDLKRKIVPLSILWMKIVPHCERQSANGMLHCKRRRAAVTDVFRSRRKTVRRHRRRALLRCSKWYVAEFFENNSQAPALTARQLGQRARRERVATEKAAGSSAALRAPRRTPAAPGGAPSRQSIAQQARRQRERDAQAVVWLPTPPPTQEEHRPLPVRRPARRRPRADGFLAARQPYEEPERCHDLGRMSFKCPHCDALHWVGEKIAKSKEDAPLFGMCCNHGKVAIGHLEEPPEPLRQLLLNDGPQGREYRNNMWQYNNALSFTSLGVKEDQSVNRGRGPPIFKIQGELCHKAGALIPAPGRVPSYAQLYIYEPHAALEYRMQNNNNLRRDTMEIVQAAITANHQYAEIFMHAHKVISRNPGDTMVLGVQWNDNYEAEIKV